MLRRYNWTAASFAKACNGVSLSTIQHISSGRVPSAETFKTIMLACPESERSELSMAWVLSTLPEECRPYVSVSPQTSMNLVAWLAQEESSSLREEIHKELCARDKNNIAWLSLEFKKGTALASALSKLIVTLRQR